LREVSYEQALVWSNREFVAQRVPLSINGIAPSTENVERKAYPLVRESFFVTKAPPPPTVARFLAFTRSPAGDEVIRANGAIPTK
jgi:ABC-type phosphate transport system substrate-binding protein